MKKNKNESYVKVLDISPIKRKEDIILNEPEVHFGWRVIESVNERGGCFGYLVHDFDDSCKSISYDLNGSNGTGGCARKQNECSSDYVSQDQLKRYSEYLSKELNKSISYSEYVAEKLNDSITYSDYIADNLNKSNSDFLSSKITTYATFLNE